MSEHTIALEDAVPGMVLASALCDAFGTVLLPQGALLSAAALAALQRRDVRQVTVHMRIEETLQAGPSGTTSAAPPVAPADTPRQGAAALQRLQHLFRHSATIEDSGQLLSLLERYHGGEAP